MTDRYLSVPVLFLGIIYCRFGKTPEGPVHSVLIRAGYARVAAWCYPYLLQVSDMLRVFLVNVGSAWRSIAATGFVLGVRGGQRLWVLIVGGREGSGCL